MTAKTPINLNNVITQWFANTDSTKLGVVLTSKNLAVEEIDNSDPKKLNMSINDETVEWNDLSDSSVKKIKAGAYEVSLNGDKTIAGFAKAKTKPAAATDDKKAAGTKQGKGSPSSTGFIKLG